MADNNHRISVFPLSQVDSFSGKAIADYTSPTLRDVEVELQDVMTTLQAEVYMLSDKERSIDYRALLTLQSDQQYLVQPGYIVRVTHDRDGVTGAWIAIDESKQSQFVISHINRVFNRIGEINIGLKSLDSVAWDGGI